MYCFPCFLFAGDTSKSGKGRFSKEWAEDGLSDWKDGLKKIYKHEKSESHMLWCEKLMYFRSGKGIDLLIDEQGAQIATQRESTNKHNRKNGRTIDLTCSAFRGHREGTNSLNRGNFLELLHHQAKYDPVLKHHLTRRMNNILITKYKMNWLTYQLKILFHR